MAATLVPGEQHGEAAGDSDWPQGSDGGGRGATGQRTSQRAFPAQARPGAADEGADRPRALCRPWGCTSACPTSTQQKPEMTCFSPWTKKLNFLRRKTPESAEDSRGFGGGGSGGPQGLHMSLWVSADRGQGTQSGRAAAGRARGPRVEGRAHVHPSCLESALRWPRPAAPLPAPALRVSAKPPLPRQSAPPAWTLATEQHRAGQWAACV